MRKIMTGVDVGSNSIKIVVGEINKDKFNILAVSDTPCKGIKKGLVINSEEVITSLKEGFKKITDLMGLPVNKVILNVPTKDLEFKLETGSTTITNPDKLIGGSDIVRAIQASVYNKIVDTRELVTAIPVEYIINDEEKVNDPKNMIADRLSIKSVVITAFKKDTYPIISCLEKIGVQVVDVCLCPLGDYYQFRNEDTDDTTGIIINIGEDITTLSVFNKGVLTNVKELDIGSINVDNDLSFIYKTNKIDTRFLKEKLALAHKRLAQPNEYEEVTNKLGEKVKINQYEITEIVMSRLEEMLNLVKKEINYLTKKEISYIIFSGGLTEIQDFQLLLDETFNKNTSIGRMNELGVRNNKYSSAAGMIKYFNSKLELRDKEFTMFNKDELQDLVSSGRRVNISSNSFLGKIFGYFFDN